jgi:kanamycin nucleotidyltransferase
MISMTKKSVSEGPQPQSHAERMRRVDQLVEHLQVLYPGQVLAVGLYGSTARGEDGPCSDIELFCVLDQPEYDRDYEWIYGAGKAEINVLGRETARREAREVDEFWAISQGRFLNAQRVFGDGRVLEDLREQVHRIADEQIRSVIGAGLVEELYEWLGKARNASGRSGSLAGKNEGITGLPTLAVKFAEMGALLVGLANRRCYKTGMTMLAESLELPVLPDGYVEICQMVMSGQLADPQRILAAVEAAWAGMVTWASRLGVKVQAIDFPDS